MANEAKVLFKVLAEVRDAVQKLNTFERALRKIEQATRAPGRSFSYFAEEAKRAEAAAKGLEGTLNRATGTVRKFNKENRDAGQATSRFGRGLASVKTAVASFLAALTVRQVKSFADELVRVASISTRVSVQLKSLSGSSELAARDMQQLRDVSNQLGISFEGVVGQFGRFALSADAIGIPLQQTKDLFFAISVATSAFRLDQAETNSVFVAFEQILSKGRVSMEELRKQLGQRLPGALGLLAKGLKVSTEDLEKLIEQGELSSSAIIALAAEYEAFYELAESGADGPLGQIERFKNLWFETKETIGNELLPALGDLLQQLSVVGKEGEGVATKVGRFLARIIGQVSDLVEAITSIANGGFSQIFIFLGRMQLKMVEFMAGILSTVGSHIPLIGGMFESIFDSLKKAAADGVAFLNKEFEEISTIQDKLAADDARRQAERRQNNEETFDRLKAAAEDEARKVQELLAKKEKDEAKSLAKRLKTYASFYEGIGNLAKSTNTTPGSGSGPSSSASSAAIQQAQDVEAAIIRLQAEIAKLQSQPIISLEEINKLSELKSELFNLQSQTTTTSSALDTSREALTQYSDEAQKLVQSLVESKSFQEQFAKSTDGAKTAIVSMIAELAGLGERGGITEQDMRNFQFSLEELGFSAGASETGLKAVADALGAAAAAAAETSAEASTIPPVWAWTTDEAGNLIQKLVQIEDGYDGMSEKIAGVTDAEAAKTQEWIESVDEAGNVIQTLVQVKEETDKVVDAKKGEAEAVKQTRLEWVETKNANGDIIKTLQEVEVSTEDAAAATKEAGDAAAEAADGIGKVTNAQGEVVEVTSTATEVIAEFSNATQDVADKAPAAAEGVDTLKESMETFGTSLNEGQLPTNLGTVAENVANLQPPLETMLPMLTQMAEDGVMTTISEAVISLVEPLTAIVEPVSAINDVVSSFAENGEVISESISTIVEKLVELSDPAIAESIEQVAVSIESINEHASAGAESLVQMNDSAGQLVSTLGEIHSFLEGQLLPTLSDIRSEISGISQDLQDASASADTLNTNLGKLQSEGLPAIQAVNGGLTTLISNLQSARSEAEALAVTLAKIELPG